jgi:hypothetical protein
MLSRSERRAVHRRSGVSHRVAAGAAPADGSQTRGWRCRPSRRMKTSRRCSRRPRSASCR